MSRTSTDTFFIDPTLLVRQEAGADTPTWEVAQRSSPQPTTPRNKNRNAITCPTSASPPPSKRTMAKKGQLGSPGDRMRGSKWSAWEDQLIKDSIVIYGEKGTDWHAILGEINTKRLHEGEEARTLNSLRLHWIKPLKGKMLES